MGLCASQTSEAEVEECPIWYTPTVMQTMKKTYLIKTKYGNFNAAIWYDRSDNLYLVEVPSFDKTMTQGSTLADAKIMAQDLIELLCNGRHAFA